MEMTKEHKRRKFLYELRDLLAGAAFPFMLQLVFSASIILFADYSGEIAVQIVALVLGEILLMGAYVIFGRQNGLTAYRRTVQFAKKRELLSDDENSFYAATLSAKKGNTSDLKTYYGTGEYALYKGFLIGFISTIPFIIFQLVNCIAPNTVCDFVLKYAFGWAAYPFIVISESPSVGELSQWLNFIWLVIPVCVHAAAYYFGAKIEKDRQQKIKEAQEMKGKRRK